MSIKCLMLETSEKKRFFTPLGSQKRLKECCEAFGTKMVVVRADLKKSQLLSIEKLVVALCDKNQKSVPADFKVLRSEKTVRRTGNRSSRR